MAHNGARVVSRQTSTRFDLSVSSDRRGLMDERSEASGPVGTSLGEFAEVWRPNSVEKHDVRPRFLVDVEIEAHCNDSISFI